MEEEVGLGNELRIEGVGMSLRSEKDGNVGMKTVSMGMKD